MPEEEAGKLLVMSTDGKGSNRCNRKRMATVASMYEVAPHLRTAEQIMGQAEEHAPKRPKVQS